MKKLILTAVLSIAAFGVDYTTMSIDEMQSIRGTVASEDKAAFQSSMQSKMQALSPEERQTYTSGMKQSKSGAQDGTGSQMRKGGGEGSGSGSMTRSRSGSEGGSGSMTRTRQGGR
ncbi:MAG: DUF1104 domain-containing protein [Epsilonproteobacteria bacterium]|nr:DUF1104 domain-containing protein [Campylobacterota bacterium]